MKKSLFGSALLALMYASTLPMNAQGTPIPTIPIASHKWDPGIAKAHAQLIKINGLRANGHFSEADAAEETMQRSLDQLEPTLTERLDLLDLATFYDEIAESHTAFGGHQPGDGTYLSSEERSRASTPSKEPNRWGRPLAQADFEIAEKLKLRALRIHDNMDDNWGRAPYHRLMAYWYKRHGKTREYNEQTEILSKLMGTSDPNVLFPAPARCPACGMG